MVVWDQMQACHPILITSERDTVGHEGTDQKDCGLLLCVVMPAADLEVDLNALLGVCSTVCEV